MIKRGSTTQKIALLTDNQEDILLARKIDELDTVKADKIEINEITANLEQKISAIKTIKGDKGDDYVLTEKDRLQIASTIKVPIVKEKIIEKTEVIREQPIIKTEVKEITKVIENKDTAEQLANKLNILDKKVSYKVLKDTPKELTIEEIAKELKNPKSKYRLEKKDIKGMRLDMSDQRWHGGGLSKVSTDGTSITGDGTPSNPLVASIPAPTPETDPLSIHLNGDNSPTANIDWGAKKITNLANPTDDKDAVNKEFTDDTYIAKDLMTTGGDMIYEKAVYSTSLITSYPETNQTSQQQIHSDNFMYWGQSFQNTSSIVLDSVKFYLAKLNSPTGSCYAQIYAHTGTFGVDGKPTGSVLATSDAIDVSTFSAVTTYTLTTFNFTGVNRITLNASTNYVVIFKFTGGGGSNRVYIATNPTGVDTGNTSYGTNGSSWTSSSIDTIYYVYGYGITSQSPDRLPIGSDRQLLNVENGIPTWTSNPKVDSLEFDVTATPSASAPGKIQWNSTDGTYDMGLLNSSVLQVGQETMFYSKASGAIANGDLCQFAGVQGDHILIKKAVGSEIESNPHYLVGVATEPIANGNFGYVTWFGKINGIYTKTPANQDNADWVAGDILYFNVTTGQMTKTMPSVPNRIITVAAVIKAQTGSSENGIIIVRPMVGKKLSELDDVNGTPLATDGQILTWHNTEGYWDADKNINDYLTDVGWTELSGNQSDINISGFNNDSGYLTYGSTISYAESAGYANSADYASSSGYADSAGSASYADTAGTANSYAETDPLSLHTNGDNTTGLTIDLETTGKITGEIVKVQTNAPTEQIGNPWLDTDEVVVNPYGEMYGDDVSITVDIVSASVYYALGTGLSSGELNGFTFADSILTAIELGKYKVDWSMTVECGTAGQYVEGAVMVNTTAQMNTVGAGEIPSANKKININGTGFLTLDVDDEVKLCLENETGTNDIIVSHATFTITKLPGEQTEILKVYNGTSWVNIAGQGPEGEQGPAGNYPRGFQLTFDGRAMWLVTPYWKVVDMDASPASFPSGTTITSWNLKCSVADPTTELNANLKYCDAQGVGGFPGANPVLIDVLDTTTGNSSCTDMSTSDLGSGVIPAGKVIYLELDANPTDLNVTWTLTINFAAL